MFIELTLTLLVVVRSALAMRLHHRQCMGQARQRSLEAAVARSASTRGVEQQRAEAALRDVLSLRSEFARAVSARACVLANVGLELRTPLALMLGAVRSIESGNPPDPRQLGAILRLGAYLDRMIWDTSLLERSVVH